MVSDTEQTLSFDRFIAIDWSGARGKRYAGIAVAVCGAGNAAPRLVTPPAGWWSRTAVFDWLATDVIGQGAALVGIDCAFSLPFAVAGRSLSEGANVFDLWDAVETTCADEPDFGGVPFTEHPLHGVGYWRAGPQPDHYQDPHRATEAACRAEGLGSPQSPYKLIGSKQVGKGGLAGMRVLRALRATAPDTAVVWPFDHLASNRTVFAEIYPRLFLKQSGFGHRKIRDGADLDDALRQLGTVPMGVSGAVSDHDSDALVSAAGLRWLAQRPGLWSPIRLDGTARRREGWILGVGCPPTAQTHHRHKATKTEAGADGHGERR